MEGQFFFTTVAGISVSLAGFASLIAALREDSRTWDPINLWRVKTIVRQAVTILFLALVLIPIFSMTNDLRVTTRLGAIGLVIGLGIDVFANRHPDPTIWVPRMSWTVSMLSSALYAALQLVNLSLANLGILQLGFLLALIEPAGIFSNFVRELGRPRRQSALPGEARASQTATQETGGPQP
jgi:hypothetical protein